MKTGREKGRLTKIALAVLLPTIADALSSTNPTHQRKFQFVDYGANAPTVDAFTIACDGRVPNADLEVSHWNGNGTPDAIYSDTSTEMALKLRKALDQNDDEEGDWPLPNNVSKESLDSALVLNNHYDTDGVCSVYALVATDDADNKLQDQAQLLIEAAESGDFDEWTTNRGLKLELTLSSFEGSDKDQYEKALQELPLLLQDMMATEGQAYQELWKDGFDQACQHYEDIKSGTIRLEKLSKEVVVVHEASSTSRVSPYALYRGLKDQGLWDETIRVLRVNQQKESDDGMVLYKYTYEKIGHGWVNKLVQRHMVPQVDPEALVEKLNAKSSSTKWDEGRSFRPRCCLQDQHVDGKRSKENCKAAN